VRLKNHSHLFYVQVVIMYIGFAFLCGLLVAAITTPVGCMVSPPGGIGFTDCMKAEFSQLF
jgi:hypothetical protein